MALILSRYEQQSVHVTKEYVFALSHQRSLENYAIGESADVMSQGLNNFLSAIYRQQKKRFGDLNNLHN